MTSFLLIQAQSVTGAVITIIALLLVAAIIGYFTAWFYARSVYTPVIKKLEEEKEELQKQVASLKDEVAGQKESINELNIQLTKAKKELSEKEREIKDLKSQLKG